MIKIENKTNGIHDIYVFDEIRDTGKNLIKNLSKANKTDTLQFHINSPGGDYFDITALLSWLKGWTGNKIAYIEGLAASAASYLLTGINTVYGYSNSLCMIHPVHTQAYGNSVEFRKLADNLDKVNQGLIEAYQRKTGQPLEIVQNWLNGETWFDAKEAKQVGLIDSIIDQSIKNCCFKYSEVDYSKKRIELMVDRLNQKFANYKGN